MKKVVWALCLWLFCASFAVAQEAWSLPAGVASLCAQAYPDYTIELYDGWGDETWGQVALVLSRDGQNILCIAEKAKEDPAYAFTVENPHALYAGEKLPSLLIDTGGDALFYSYMFGTDSHVGYHSVKSDGAWGAVDIIATDSSDPEKDTQREVYVKNSWLHMQVSLWDKLENRLPGGYDLLSVPVSLDYARSFELAQFDIEAVDPFTQSVRVAPGLCAGRLEEGDELLELDVQRESLIMFVRKADGSHRVRIEDADGRVVESGPLPENMELDTVHPGDGKMALSDYMTRSYGFSRSARGEWRLTYVQTDEIYQLCYDGVADFLWPTRNDGVTYGVSPLNAPLQQLNLMNIPQTAQAARALLDTDAYALVVNPDPADRLNLREQPDKGARTLGKFYNRTPVRVLGTQGDWVQVRIGNETDGLTGYMMREFLAFGEEKEAVTSAFADLFLLDSLQSETARERPDAGAQARFTLSDGMYWVIGVYGEDWLIVMSWDGTVGYAPAASFWPGNG